MAWLDALLFAVAIIPYTFAHTTLHSLHTGSRVNLEFDILGKYVARQLAAPSLQLFLRHALMTYGFGNTDFK